MFITYTTCECFFFVRLILFFLLVPLNYWSWRKTIINDCFYAKLNEATVQRVCLCECECVYASSVCVNVNERMNDVSAVWESEYVDENALSMCTAFASVWLSIRRGKRFNLDRSVVVLSGASNVSSTQFHFVVQNTHFFFSYSFCVLVLVTQLLAAVRRVEREQQKKKWRV